MNKKHLFELADEAVRSALRSNVSLNSLEDVELLKLLYLNNPSVTIAKPTALSTTALYRLSAIERRRVSSLYNEGSYVSVIVDGWLATLGDKWLGFCRIIRFWETSKVVLDVMLFDDVTKRGETEPAVSYEMNGCGKLFRILYRNV